MGKPKGFMELGRDTVPYRDPLVRLKDFQDISTTPLPSQMEEQGARCMDCGVPFCQSGDGCPIDNLIPEWNHLVYRGDWYQALLRLEETNNFPEFTGKVCPAPCEGACVLGITDPPVTIKNIIHQHFDSTKSSIACQILENWMTEITQFMRVIPTEYKEMLSSTPNRSG